MQRRTMLMGIGCVMVQGAGGAWAQAIGRQTDPYAQVDPYADPRNGFPNSGFPGQSAGHPSAPSSDGVNRKVFQPQSAAEDAGPETKAAFARLVVEDGGGLHPDPAVQQAISRFIQPFTRATNSPRLEWQAVVSRSPHVNAWTVGGGKMCIHPGLIRLLSSPGELAAVVCHEMGHVEHGHSAERLRMLDLLRVAGANGSLGRAAPGVRDPNGQPVPVGAAMVASYSRQQEDQADAYSLELLERAGWDPAWAMRLMEKFVRLEMVHGHHGATQLTDDHPSARDRLENMRRLYGVGRTAPRAEPQAMGWDVLKAAIG